MTAVARGAAIFASTIEVGDAVEEEQKKEVESAGGSLLQLDAKYEATSVLEGSCGTPAKTWRRIGCCRLQS